MQYLYFPITAPVSCIDDQLTLRLVYIVAERLLHFSELMYFSSLLQNKKQFYYGQSTNNLFYNLIFRW